MRLLTLLLCLLLPSLSIAQDRFRVRVNGKYGYIDREGELVIPAKYDGAGNFSEGLARIEVDVIVYGDTFDHTVAKWGFIDPSGEVVIEPTFDSAGDFQEGLAQVKQDRRRGYVNAQGELAVPLQFSRRVGDFHEGLSAVELGQTSVGYIDAKGKLVFRLDGVDTSAVNDFSGGLVRAETTAGALRYHDRKGELKIECSFEFGRDFREGLAVVRTKKDHWAYMNTKGELVIPDRFLFGWGFSGGFAVVSEEGVGKHYIDAKGDSPFSCAAFDDLSSFSEGLARVRSKENGKYGYVDREGKWVIEPVWDDAESSYSRFQNGMALVGRRVDKKLLRGWIDRSGKLIWEPSR